MRVQVPTADGHMKIDRACCAALCHPLFISDAPEMGMMQTNCKQRPRNGYSTCNQEEHGCPTAKPGQLSDGTESNIQQA